MLNCTRRLRSAIAASSIASLLAFHSVAASGSQSTWSPAQAYGPAWSPALGAWLPKIGAGFDAWNQGLTSLAVKEDFLVCGAVPISAPTPFHNFYYAARGCPMLANGTYFVYGNAGPSKGHVIYDPLHNAALYEEGCCAWGTVTLASGVGAPPNKVQSADLGAVHTARGITLGMTEHQVVGVYGRAQPHKVPSAPNVVMLSYTTLSLKPANRGSKCGQFQNFAFRKGRLVYIELMAGC